MRKIKSLLERIKNAKDEIDHKQLEAEKKALKKKERERYRAKNKETPEYKAKMKKYGKTRHANMKINNPEALANIGNRAIARVYGISHDEYIKLSKGPCELCGTDIQGGKRTKFCVDHCHKTGRVRGALCTKCNISIGHLERLIDSNILTKAFMYINVI